MEKKTLKKISILLLLWMFWPLVFFCTAQSDAPRAQAIVPLNPKRVFKVTYHLLSCVYDNITGPFLPSILQYGWHKLSTERKPSSVRRNIRYGTRPRNRLDVYLPDRVSTTVLKNSPTMPVPTNTTMHTPSTHENPVIILISTSWSAGNKSTCMPVAHNLQSQGYVVVVPDITLYPRGKIAEMVADIQQQFHGDPSQIYLLGHAAGALICALTIVHDVCASLDVLPPNTTEVNLPIWDNAIRRTPMPRVQGLILFSGNYDVIYYYAYLFQKGLEQVHAMPRVMGNSSETFLQCSPTYLLQHALAQSTKRDQLKMLLPRKILLIHGGQDAFNPPVATRTFFDLLVSSGVPSVQLKLYENERHISPRIDLIVPTKRLCAILIEDIAECCKAATGAVMMRGCLKEDDNNQRKVDGKDNIGIKPVQEGTGIRVLG
ncbi:3991_t:CDS:10 [Paraglomus brasilianum]|uniref:3991_t:CDS:1 n=1 Tax=Paraglomus brasilianum TaxID=144538 RepID=A0A9N8VN96_9GLOM|nr:3991_t:CDS:10 [Paraglomus brasilianum]